MFSIEWKEKAIRDLNKLNRMVAKRIYTKVDKLRKEPFSGDLKKLKNEDVFRFRVGDYRILLEINKKLITILKIAHRKNIYRK